MTNDTTVRKAKCCCNLFYKWMYEGCDEYISYNDKGGYTVAVDYYHDPQKIHYCPFCGKSLHLVHAPQDTNIVTIDGRIIHDA